jgi:hypothetical protein
MKRIITLLLIVCNAVTTVNAQLQAKKPTLTTPVHVQTLFDNIIKNWGHPYDEVYSVNKNPTTNVIESSVRITNFEADNSTMFLDPKSIREAFKKDEYIAYQLLHLSPGSNEFFSLKAVSESGESKSYNIRTNSKVEMWLLCAKNPENPKLRDAYAIKWKFFDDEWKIRGTIYQITSLRPDIYEKEQETSKKTFKIEGRVDANIKDSLYNIYIANSAEELANIGDDDYVACVPVVNKRFEWQTELDQPCVGRLRSIFPDGSLCSAWIDLDFVPGETYHITVHNGYYDDDVAYEQRVGRFSGKSLIAPQQESVTITGDFKFEDSKDDEEAAKTNVNARVNAIQAEAKMIDEVFDAIKNMHNPSHSQLEPHFKQILTLSKSIDTRFQGLANSAKDNCLSPNEQREMYKFIIDMYRYQNRKLNEVSAIRHTKSAKKLQKYINGQIEKYLNDMSKL